MLRTVLRGLGGMSALKADMFEVSEDVVAREAAMPPTAGGYRSSAVCSRRGVRDMLLRGVGISQRAWRRSLARRAPQRRFR